MRILVLIVAAIFSFNSYALGGYDSLTKSQQSVVKKIVEQLGINDTDNSVKYKVYEKIDYAFKGDWNTYWYGLTDLSASKYKDGKEKGFIEYAINNSEAGTLFLTFIHRPEVDQIIVMRKQVRYGEKTTILDAFEEKKADTENYKVTHEKDNYALLQKKGRVDFEYFHVGKSTASLIYADMSTIDL